MTNKVFAFPTDVNDSIAERLREVAKRIEDGEFGTVHSVTFVADLGDGEVHVELIGNSPLPGPTAHLMLHMGMLKLASG